ncbi:MAG: ATPase [Gammaproteobacteria bacterium]|nr:ATPase [Gammaproteobacteria bacterium]
MSFRIVAASLALSVPAISLAEVRLAAPDGAIVEHRFQVAATAEATWAALVHPELWWPDQHTWSGSHANLQLIAHAGGCYCESWGENSVEHGRVIMALPGKQIRILGSLGPLQDMAVTAVLKVSLAAKDGGTEAVVTYRMSGDASQKLDAIAPAVDRALGEQFGAFARYAASASAKPAT